MLQVSQLIVHSSGGSRGVLEPDPPPPPHCQNAHKNDHCTVSCKLASKPIFSDTSVAKQTVEAVVDLKVNDQIVNFLYQLSACTLKFPYG